MEIIQDNWYDSRDVEIQDYTKSPIDLVLEKTLHKTGEMLDIYTEDINYNGKRTYTKVGKMQREEAHLTGALHTGAQVWVYNPQGYVLLQKRAMTVKSSPGLLDTSAAGHVRSGKTIIDDALCELKDEIGLMRKPEDLLHIGNYRRETKKITTSGFQHNNEINKVFLLKYEGGIHELKKQKSEVSELTFITLEQLEDDWKNPQTIALYTSKGEQYRQMVLMNIKNILGCSR